ncbi:OFA family MFS transporter [Tsukamurella sp. 8F]|uniref:OFA family MFS transporter n=1 Tax=unclassified Tsukamurella TaxID=2633480 RepID=UPI0023B8D6B6|nr:MULTISPECIES: OFA family MFS transporter [unclassified Tsukamurella]MDF0531395.1 OFA family MFS transporter [Tsukamurella sp. 8J]MDF0585299.1 OFA family MFS transporter [Tsukamurella sp. 8F]
MPALSFLDRQHSVAPAGYSRWLVPPAALAVHICIGQVYATSVYKTQLIDTFHASETTIGLIFSIAVVVLGLSAAVFGPWVDRGGPRRAMFTAACCWGTGFLVASLGVATTQLWLVYLGYGVIGGIGLGIGYISPVSTLMKWFPDRPGLATGMAIMGFGGGALVASPLCTSLMSAYGAPSTAALTAAAETAHGSGATAAATDHFATLVTDTRHAVSLLLLTLGIAYFAFMMLGTFLVRVPAPGWMPHGFDPSTVRTKAMVTTANVSANNALRTPQFWLLWVVLLCNVTAGIGILENASPMIQDFFRGSNAPVGAATAAGFVGLLSIFNMGGRIVWSSASDGLGRKRTYMMYLGCGLVFYVLLSIVGDTTTALFVILAALIVSFYGGGFSTAPAYLRDLFGTYQVGAIHGRLLTAWSTAGVLGPLIVNTVLDAQGTPGTLRAHDYLTALYIMVGILALGFVANLFIRPVSERWTEKATVVDAVDAAHRG